MKFELNPVRTYASINNAQKSVDALVSKELQDTLRWYIAEQNGRFFPVFVGERAAQAGMHFHFNVIG